MIEIYRKSLKDKYLKLCKKPVKGSWLFIYNPTKDEIIFLEKNLNIESTQILDALDEYETPHLEIIDNKLYIFIRYFLIKENEIKMIPILFIITQYNVLTICREKLNLFDYFLQEKIEFFTTQKTKFLLILLLKINKNFKILINKLTKEIDIYQNKIINISDKEIIEISKKEILLSNFLSTLVSINKVYEILLKKEYLDFLREEKDIVDDLSLSAKELIEILTSNLKRVKTIKDTYSTILSNRVNLRLQFLTVITILLSIPVIIFSLYGMNISLPYQDNKFIFIYLLILNIFLIFIFYLIFKIKNWF